MIWFRIPIRVTQLVRVNAKKCGPSKRHMIPVLNPTIDDILNLPGVGCCMVVSTLRFEVHGGF